MIHHQKTILLQTMKNLKTKMMKNYLMNFLKMNSLSFPKKRNQSS
jgi:hypothetical protein